MWAFHLISLEITSPTNCIWYITSKYPSSSMESLGSKYLVRLKMKGMHFVFLLLSFMKCIFVNICRSSSLCCKMNLSGGSLSSNRSCQFSGPIIFSFLIRFESDIFVALLGQQCMISYEAGPACGMEAV